MRRRQKEERMMARCTRRGRAGQRECTKVTIESVHESGKYGTVSTCQICNPLMLSNAKQRV